MALLQDRMDWAGGLYPPPTPPLPYREARAVLGQYERASSWLRATAGGVLFLIAVAVPPSLLALGVFAVHGDLAAYAVGLASLCTAWLPGWAWKQRLWGRPVRRRLVWRTAFDPRVATVSARLAHGDSAKALKALRHAGMTYQYVRISAADRRSVTIAVAQWAFGTRRDDFAFRDQVCEVFRAARISANVGGIEVNADR